MAQDFIHLRLYSTYSLSKGAIKIKALPKLCKYENMPALAITDMNNMFGALEFANTCQHDGIQAIIGISLTMFSTSSRTLLGQESARFELLLLAQNEVGYKNLMKISSMSFLDAEIPGQPEFPLHKLREYSSGIIALSGGINGAIGTYLRNKNYDVALSNLNFLKETFGDRFYIEIIRDKQERLIEADLLKLAIEHNIPIVATNHVFFESPDMQEAHDALLCIEQGTFISDENRLKSDPDYYFKSQQEMKELFADLPEALANTIAIAKRCYYMPEETHPILPQITTTIGKNVDEELRILALEGLKFRFKEHEINHEEQEQYITRFDYETQMIVQMGFSSYFLIVSDFIRYANENGIAVGPGRGSGAGSLVAWSLRITNVDPIKFKLIFERFLNPERVSMPDFDIDFCQERRDEIIQYVCNKYGNDKVAHIITFGTLQARAVLRDVGRVLGIPYGLVDKISKLVPNNPSNPLTLQEAIDIEPSISENMKSDATIRKMVGIALKLEGLHRHASVHAAGIVISNCPITEIVPLYKDPKSEIPVTQFNMKMVEKAGLVKFDFLGLKTLTMIQKTCELLQKRDIYININKIPLDDSKTFDLINKLETVGIFQLESAGMRSVIKLLQPDKFEDIVALISLYRPGPMDDIPTYAARKHGREKITYAHELIKEILEPTYGVMVYQEQVMHIAQVLAGYSMGQADLLRRAMGKKIHAEMIVHRQRFIDGAAQNNMPNEEASNLFDQIAKFAGYGFNKSHATPYALISYQTAYLKANYPIEFMTATMNLDRSNTSKLGYFSQNLSEIGITILPPDIQKSEELFSVEAAENGELRIRYGLSAIKGAGEAAMQEIYKSRTQFGEFKDLTDFLLRFNTNIINKKQLESLISSGAFDSFAIDRGELFENVSNMIRFRNNYNSQQGNLFALEDEKFSLTPCKQWDLFEKLNHELDAIGFYLSDHPLAVYKNQIEQCGIINYANLNDIAQTENILMCGIVLKVVKKISKTGKQFVFIHMSDMSGIFEIVAFSETLSKYQSLLETGKILLVKSSIKHDGEMIHINAVTIEEFDPSNGTQSMPTSNKNEFTIRIKSESHLNNVYKILQNTGSGGTFINLIINGKKIKIGQGYNIQYEDRMVLEK